MRSTTLLGWAGAAAVFLLGAGTDAAPQSADAAEPDVEMASRWWTDIRDIWTPVGWKDHLFRFNVLFDGTLVARPDLNRRTEKWRGQGIQLTFVPSALGSFPALTSMGDKGRGSGAVAPTYDTYAKKGGPPSHLRRDDGGVVQGWQPGAVPVLWSDWSHDGLVLRQEIFAHVPGARPVASGVEPLFAWIRLSVRESHGGRPAGFLVKINTPHITTTMDYGVNLQFHPEESAYPRPLVPDPNGAIAASGGKKGWTLRESDGKVRLAMVGDAKATVAFTPGKPTAQDAQLQVIMDGKKGSHVDLLVPMLPTKPAVFERERAVGFDRARKEAARYWSVRPATAARIETPEPFVNQVISHSLKFSEIISERDPATGNTSLLSGSYTYANLWTTPQAMNAVMLLDTLGYHAAVAKYLEQFMREQGTVVPPGRSYKLHPGYLSTPMSLKSIDWLSDHGALLYTIATHVLLSGDHAFAARWTDAIVKACDFIKDARAMKVADARSVPGVMPAAVATDTGNEVQGVWNDGWTYKGLTTAVRVLQDLRHPRADEFAAEARDYREGFNRAFRAKLQTMPRWKDARGKEHPMAPTGLSGDLEKEMRHAFYLDAGPLFLVFAGLMDADDDIMRSTLAFFREGPNKKTSDVMGAPWLPPTLTHEMSSCEPCYSWNIFHSHATGDRARFLEGMYSVFAGSISRETFISCETRGGITGTVFSAPLAIYLARLSMIDDQIQRGDLHLLRLMPLAWLKSGATTTFDDVPTEFGPVSLRTRLDGDTLHVTFKPRLSRWRNAPSRIVLHVPPIAGLARLTLNGKALPWDGKQESLVVTASGPVSR